jgi:1-hydroxycarotenoid 3,4-desaturase
MTKSTVIIGAGAGALSAAIALAAKGEAVTVLEKQPGPGGKLLPARLGQDNFDTGPTVLTMRWVMESVFELADENLSDHLGLTPLSILARHVWRGGETFDLYASKDQTVDAIANFADPTEARGYESFAKASASIHTALRDTFMKAQKPTPWGLAASMRLGDVLRINPFDTYWNVLKKHFKDPRLRQLFGRYATYCGTSPFKAPATLMLVADVEAQGVWTADGGMAAVAQALADCARRKGVTFHFNTSATTIETAANRVTAVIDSNGVRHPCTDVVVNADSQAVATGLLGRSTQQQVSTISPSERSFSAITWCLKADTSGMDLSHHNVFFSDDYEAEFRELETNSAQDPTVYLCDQGDNRKLILINAPANGKCASTSAEAAMRQRLLRSGLAMTWPPHDILRRDPKEFATLYPATGGALYGRASNGWMSTFLRPQARTKMKGLYLAGGSTHPGPGVPMAMLAGLRAAQALLQDRALT